MSDRFNQPYEITPSVREAVKKFEEYMIKKDPITYKHCKDVETKVRAFYVFMPERFWAQMGVNRSEISDKIDELSIGALMHDAGKLFIDDSIVNYSATSYRASCFNHYCLANTLQYHQVLHSVHKR